MKFGSDTAGTITGIRFYKGASNTGTYIGLSTAAAELCWHRRLIPEAQPLRVATGKLHRAGDNHRQYNLRSRLFQHLGVRMDGNLLHFRGRGQCPAARAQTVLDGRTELHVRQHAAIPRVQLYRFNWWVEWCLRYNTVQGAPDLTITSSHSGQLHAGADWRDLDHHGEQCGNGADSGTVTVTEPLPAGLDSDVDGGTNWNCTQPAGRARGAMPWRQGAILPSL